MIQSLANGLASLIGMVVEAYLYMVLTRVLFYAFRVPYSNPLYQTALKWSEPLTRVFYKVLPPYKQYDLPAILLVCVMQAVRVFVCALLTKLNWPNEAGWLVLTVGYVLMSMSSCVFFTIVFWVMMNFIPNVPAEMRSSLDRVCLPIMKPVRQWMPVPATGWDFSPMLALAIIKALDIAFLDPLINWGKALI